ncbi:hypothetical protein PC119_g1818 [Phytophthora cactorum]|uniref:Uncharacterized protein n=1 Tax=Phytophthora cactorum TaxID=29920 RepID=A0A8T1ECJ1_9STRA|nr:hypothetical protein PC114_g3900 [Phytophthora cactorum]KAG2951323.1 hypothetical protein PC117_g3702 [Phytophthora cactorum]KAG3023319.1 hypothetical protein PC120_g7616 [Phytophthora cactorum]KAG3039904.1 hypothetical protein PC119_g1818 [Phytophthora cactorum]KAG3187762.1 hypothetical protein C6341_g3089 [Phytophthora cactorum]
MARSIHSIEEPSLLPHSTQSSHEETPNPKPLDQELLRLWLLYVLRLASLTERNGNDDTVGKEPAEYFRISPEDAS